MIRIEHVIIPSDKEIEFTIEGMRNPKNSWTLSDSTYENDKTQLGPNDRKLMFKLAMAGTEHRKYLRMLPVYARITAPLYWWKEFDTYKVGTVSNSCSTMHKLADKEFVISDFSMEHLDGESLPLVETDINDKPYTISWSAYDHLSITCEILNHYRTLYLETKDMKYWWQMIQLLPSSYNQTRNIMMNYEVLANIYRQRRFHKLTEWVDFCLWIENDVPYSNIICDY